MKRIIKQDDGKYAVWSTKADKVVAYNLTYLELITHYLIEAIPEILLIFDNDFKSIGSYNDSPNSMKEAIKLMQRMGTVPDDFKVFVQDTDSLVLKFDGACDNNSKFKFMGVGVAVWLNGVRRFDLEVSEMHGVSGTSNIAEWAALLEALRVAYEFVAEYPNTNVKIFGDSQLIVRQFTGRYRIKKEHFLDYQTKANMYRKLLGNRLKSVEWVRREKNKEADKLSKDGIVSYKSELDK